MQDEHGQPPSRFSQSRLSDRGIDELIGLCRGVLADGVLVEAEVRFLADWLDRHRHIADQWPAVVLYKRIQEVLADGVMDSDEERDLLATLMDLAGAPVLGESAASMSTALPLDDPPPSLTFDGWTYCFTGTFACGTRSQVQQVVRSLGAKVCTAPTLKTNIVVIGSIGSRDWIHSSYGRKIESAVAMRERGHRIALVGEEHWYETVSRLTLDG
ncbi:MAG: NAD-dependent DNA ligase [Sphingobacteriia bacterium]|nr:NAD-dependent DNA ligase [Sphingobacteriia bacterium]